jgi:hypothetical protein
MALLEEPCRTVAIIYSAQGVIDNGGLAYFFEADWPNQPPYSLFVEAYRRIGKDDSADAIQHAANSFGIPEPEKHQQLRDEFMQRHFWTDDDSEPTVQWDNTICGDKEVWSKLAQWIRAEGGAAFQEELTNRLRTIPGVGAAGGISRLPATGSYHPWGTRIDTGPLTEPVVASAATPVMFPAVAIDGRWYIDGGVVNDVPIRQAVRAGAKTVYVLEVGRLSRAWAEPSRPVRMAVEAYWIARRHRYLREFEELPDDVAVHVLPHDSPRDLRFHDITRSGELIEGAYKASSTYLASEV